MRKATFYTLFFLGIVSISNAQDLSKNAIGLRLGDSDGFGGEISYQRALSSDTRLEFDLGWRNSNQVDAVKLTGLHQWVWNIEGGFNWYAGVGGGFGSWSAYGENDLVLFGAGDIGIEYNFDDIPVQLSLDFRPEIYFLDGVRNDNYSSDIALGIRYKF